MKRPSIILATLLIVISFTATAQKTYPGRWIETQRTTREGTTVAYKDSMRLIQVTSDSLKMMKGSFAYNGLITNDLLDMGYQQFQIIKLSTDEIKIGDDDYIHILKPVITTNASPQVNKEINAMTFPSEQVKAINKDLLKGVWEPYKKERKKGANGKINYQSLLKKLDFNTTSAQAAYGIAVVGNNNRYNITDIANGNFTTKDEQGNKHILIVWRLNADEIIIEDEDGMIYYLKQF